VTQAWSLPLLEPYPERDDPRHHWLDAVETAVLALPRKLAARFRRHRWWRMVGEIAACEADLVALSDEDLSLVVARVRAKLRRDGLADQAVVRGFALVRELARRHVGIRHHDVQIFGALALLEGCVAEMDTGEGKTITAVLAAATAAFAGMPVHVVTVNDYLAARDARELEPIYRALGLSVGTIVHGRSPEERRAAYDCDVTYPSTTEIAFDYLRDRIAMGLRPRALRMKVRRLQQFAHSEGRVMRGLHFAIVDEADSVLIDEARTPLIISRETSAVEESRWAEDALGLVGKLSEGRDYRVLREDRRIELTAAGRNCLAELSEEMEGVWRSQLRREEAARQALSALLLFQRGDHYLVRDGRVEIVDEYTGRIMADRSWSDGLHQLVEAKEGCQVTARKLPVARMTYQRFFRRYRRLSGMTGTARETTREFWTVYRLRVICVPTNRHSRRRRLPVSFSAHEGDKWRLVVARTQAVTADQRAVLIGTRSVAASLRLSAMLKEAGFEHSVLNAENDHDEAAIIANAGEAGRVTVATNMAGRGVHIRLAPIVAERGGLHVILTERHDAARIDRQLEGRTGRGGEPGSTEAILSLKDPLLDLVIRHALRPFAQLPGPPGRMAAHLLFKTAQRRAERAHYRARRAMLAEDRRLGVLLAFSGGME
jgi:preprotein translocase subunit SecA